MMVYPTYYRICGESSSDRDSGSPGNSASRQKLTVPTLPFIPTYPPALAGGADLTVQSIQVHWSDDSGIYVTRSGQPGRY